MTTPRRLRRPEPRRESSPLLMAAKLRRLGYTVQPWQIEYVRTIDWEPIAVLPDRDLIQEGLTAIKAQLRYGLATANLLPDSGWGPSSFGCIASTPMRCS